MSIPLSRCNTQIEFRFVANVTIFFNSNIINKIYFIRLSYSNYL